MSGPRIVIVTPPATEPVSVSDAKLYARISNDAEDTLVASWIKAAREMAEGYQRRSYVEQVIDVVYDDWPVVPFMLPMSPVSSVDSVKYYGTDDTEYTLDLDTLIIDTDVDPARIDLAYGLVWPTTTLRPMSGVKIQYTCGYATVPQSVIDAIMLYVAYRYENRSGEIAELPRHFYDLLRPDRMVI